MSEGPKFDFTRREALSAGGTFIGASILARRTGADPDAFSIDDVEEAEIEKQGLQFFTIEQAEIVQDMANRIYPSDENGPGAPEAGVVYFIDRQMNQDWGQGENWYMDGPFPGVDPLDLDTAVEEADPVGAPVEAEGVGDPPEHGEDDDDEADDENGAENDDGEDDDDEADDENGAENDDADDDDDEGDDENGAENDDADDDVEDEEAPDEFEGDPEDPEEEVVDVAWADEEPAEGQGWQYPITPAEAYTYSIDFVEEYCEEEYGDGFVDLDEEEQDEVIAALEDDDVDTFEGLSPSSFFLQLRENTLEGMFADPMYGGNQDMVGWRLKNFPGTPGALGSYREHIEDEEYHEIDDPRSIADDVEEIGLNPDGEHEH